MYFVNVVGRLFECMLNVAFFWTSNCYVKNDKCTGRT